MSFAGHVFDMISRAKENRSMINRRKKMKQIREEYPVWTPASLPFREQAPLTAGQKLIIRETAIQERASDRRRMIIALIATLAISSVIIYALIIFARWIIWLEAFY